MHSISIQKHKDKLEKFLITYCTDDIVNLTAVDWAVHVSSDNFFLIDIFKNHLNFNKNTEKMKTRLNKLRLGWDKYPY